MSALPDISDALFEFLARHRDTPADTLLLRPPPLPAALAGVPIAFVADQVQARRELARKLPDWVAQPRALFPPRRSREQASSAATAAYKHALVGTWLARDGAPRGRFADLCAGMGVDAFALARLFAASVLCEREPLLAALLRHNASVFAHAPGSVHVVEGDGLASLAGEPDDSFDLLYLDPARRDAQGARVTALADCTPDAIAARGCLLAKAPRVLLKAAPMLDIDLACAQLGCVSAVHVVSSEGDCKELLFQLERAPGAAPTIVAAPADHGAPWAPFAFTREQERAAAVEPGDVDAWLYEPDPALLKSGAFRLLGARFGLRKLHANTHLYTSTSPCAGFPGRRFAVEGVAACNARGAKQLFPDGRALVLARNVGANAEAMRRRLGLADGGEVFAIATTQANGQRVLVRARISRATDR